MILFLSYAHDAEEREAPKRGVKAAARLLRARGHTVYEDGGLTPGEDWRLQLRSWVFRSRLLVFFISPEAIEPGRFCLTELRLANECWPRVRLLPVMHTPETSLVGLPFTNVQVLTPSGDFVTDVCDAIERRSRLARWTSFGVLMAALTLTAIALIVLLKVLEVAHGGELTHVANVGLWAGCAVFGLLAFFALRRLFG
jgi:hypothetical protein